MKSVALPLGLLVIAVVAGCAAPASVRNDYDPTMPFGPQSPWLARPSAEASRRITPSAVSATRELQSAYIRCRIAASGRLANCVVDHESLPGAGLGRAALEAAQLSFLRPMLTNGEPSAGRFVGVSMHFDVGGPVDRADYGQIFPVLDGLSDTMPRPAVVLNPD
jgi:hypothetical protein